MLDDGIVQVVGVLVRFKVFDNECPLTLSVLSIAFWEMLVSSDSASTSLFAVSFSVDAYFPEFSEAFHYISCSHHALENVSCVFLWLNAPQLKVPLGDVPQRLSSFFALVVPSENLMTFLKRLFDP